MRKTLPVLIFVLAYSAEADTALAQTIQDCGNGSYQIQNDPRPRLTMANYIVAAHEGDLIIGSNYNRTVQGIFNAVTGSRITHVAMVVKHDGGLAVLDASRSVGVQLYDVKEYINSYPGYLCVRQRVGPEARPGLRPFYRRQVGIRYANLKELAKVPFSMPVVRDIDPLRDIGKEVQRMMSLNGGWFCSSLTTTAAQVAGWVDWSVNPAATEPVHWFLAENYNWDLPQVLHRR